MALLLALPLCGCAAAPLAAPQFSSQYKTRISALVGYRALDDDFEPVEEQTAFGLELDIRQPGEYVGFEIGLHHSEDDGTLDLGGLEPVEFKGSTNEFFLGGRWYYDDLIAGVEPYIGIGLSILSACYESNVSGGASNEDSDWSPALYVRAGLLRELGDFALGIEYRCTFFSEVEIDNIDDESVSADYGQAALVVGYSF